MPGVRREVPEMRMHDLDRDRPAQIQEMEITSEKIAALARGLNEALEAKLSINLAIPFKQLLRRHCVAPFRQ